MFQFYILSASCRDPLSLLLSLAQTINALDSENFLPHITVPSEPCGIRSLFIAMMDFEIYVVVYTLFLTLYRQFH